MVNQPICRLLLCCSGGMTTAFFADKIKNGIKVLNLNMEVAATSYQKYIMLLKIMMSSYSLLKFLMLNYKWKKYLKINWF